ncbi:MAG: hypothetical protein IIA60_02980 [Candidatus Marinimicrobia bacterium]|nr:hypothetical protein [Candidatus Neomarinimicrobiota bacterium]
MRARRNGSLGGRDNNIIILLVSGLLLAGPAQADDDEKVRVGGMGFSMSSGQSIFYTRGTSPYHTNQFYYATGIHIEEKGLALTYYNPYTNQYERDPSQEYFLELGLGWSRLMFQEKLAGGFFPHTNLQLGASGYVVEVGRWNTVLQDFSLRWTPYYQAGLGGSIYTDTAVYRVEGGYRGTVRLSENDPFPSYEGPYLSIVMFGSRKPR